jgi:hypothetical protein
MNPLKSIGQAFIQWIKQAWSLPPIVSDFIQRRRQQSLLEALEIERLDRIRNPEKYRGK